MKLKENLPLYYLPVYIKTYTVETHNLANEAFTQKYFPEWFIKSANKPKMKELTKKHSKKKLVRKK